MGFSGLYRYVSVRAGVHQANCPRDYNVDTVQGKLHNANTSLSSEAGFIPSLNGCTGWDFVLVTMVYAKLLPYFTAAIILRKSSYIFDLVMVRQCAATVTILQYETG